MDPLPSGPRFEVVARTPAGDAPPPSEYPALEASAPASGGLLEYGRIIRRNKGFLLLASFLGALAAFLFTLPRTPVFEARGAIEIQPVNENFLNMRDVNPTTQESSYLPEYDVQTAIRVLQSRSLLERTVNKLDLEHRPAPAEPGRISAWRRALGLAAPALASRAALLVSSLKIRGQANTRVIDITCDSSDPRLAADFVNTLAREFIEQNLESRWKSTQDTGAWLARQMEDVRIKLEKSNEQLETYARATGLLFTSEKNNVAEEKLRLLQEELSKAQADRAAKQSRHETAAAAAPESLGDVLDDTSLRDAQSRLTDLRRQRAELAASFTPEHPKVKRVESQIVELESLLAAERQNIVHRIGNDFETARRREDLLAADYLSQTRLMSGQADQVANYNILRREVDTNRQLYDAMLQRVKEAGIASALRASNIRILDPALPPLVPYKPDLLAGTLIGLMVGALGGLLAIVLRDRSDRTLQDPGDTSFYLGVPELGLIPAAEADPLQRRNFAPGRLPTADVEPEPERFELVTWRRKPCAMAESFRAAITSILFAPRTGDRSRIIVLSSPAPKEGKTTVATNLAIALAEIGCRVLLVDADLRKPRLHYIFNLENDHGLADLLRSADPLKTPLSGVLQPTEIPGLTVLTSGRSGLAEAALLYSEQFREVLDLFRNDYGIVLMDTPPMLTMPDARVLGRMADGVILVARARQTSRDSMQAACKRFLDDGTNVLGTILNDWDPKHSSRPGNIRYYDRYRHYYGNVSE
jgi:polysaccharide biosynthesis transport protein